MPVETRATPRQDRSGKSIDVILDAAERLVPRVGISNISTVLVAEEAGISVGKVYYWFTDKSALIEAVESRTQRQFTEFLDNSLVEAADLSTPELVNRFISSFIDYCRDRPGTLELLSHQSEGDEALPFRSHMLALIEGLVAIRVSDSTAAERSLVADVLVATATSVASRAVAATPEMYTLYVEELVYLVANYLASRYPTADNPIWADESRHIRPARASNAETVIAEHLFPALHQNDPRH